MSATNGYAKRRGLTIAIFLASVASPAVAWGQADENAGQTSQEETPPSDGAMADGEILVTATRSSAALSKVPISIAAMGTQQLDDRGIKGVEDIVKTVPGVSFSRVSATGTSLAIRGIASESGASTTGVYINDTPIQSRAIGQSFSFSTVYPTVFDLERVEILRGPQGTLFGAGSQGGTVRFITPKPDLEDYSAYARGELATTDNGAASYEAGAAIGGPLVPDKIGVRASAFYRRDGGYIDRIDAVTGEKIERNVDSVKTLALRAAVTFAPVEELEITPGTFLQKIVADNSSTFEPLYSDQGSGDLNTTEKIPSKVNDRLIIPTLDIKYESGGVSFYSNTAFINRRSNNSSDLGRFVASLFGTVTPELMSGALADYSNLVLDRNTQKAFSQELRIQSADSDTNFRWVLGAFYQRSKQRAIELIPDTVANMDLLTTTLTGLDALTLLGVPLVNYDYGGLGTGDFSYVNDVTGTDRQLAGFADFTYRITDKLSINAGVRVAKTKFSFTSLADGPFNGGLGTASGSQKESPVTPKVNISYQADNDNLFYATAAKGYRVGGANAPLPGYCLAELGPLGYPNGVPESYNSDSVWSYEVGSKNSLFDGRLRTSASAYLINWSNIQQTVNISCGGFVDNLGKARSKGVELSLDARVTDNLDLSVAAGYTDAKFTKTLLGDNGPAYVLKGDAIAVSPWLVSATANQRFQVQGHELAVRLDYQYQSAPRQGSEFNPLSSQYNPRAFSRKEQHNVNFRLGAQLDRWDLAFFVRNLLNTHVTTFSQTPNRRNNFLDEFQTVRPRTVGLQATYRY